MVVLLRDDERAPHRQPTVIEIWFGLNGSTVYMLSGGGSRSDWVRNLRAHPETIVRLGDCTFRGSARVVTDSGEESMARRLLTSKYQNWQEGRPLSSWASTALLVAIDLRLSEAD